MCIRDSATATIGEKISFRRVAVVEKADDEIFGSYMHMGGSISAVVVVKGDVYKRQLLQPDIEFWSYMYRIGGRQRDVHASVRAVSYTHLDVYKRQHQWRFSNKL